MDNYWSETANLFGELRMSIRLCAKQESLRDHGRQSLIVTQLITRKRPLLPYDNANLSIKRSRTPRGTRQCTQISSAVFPFADEPIATRRPGETG